MMNNKVYVFINPIQREREIRYFIRQSQVPYLIDCKLRYFSGIGFCRLAPQIEYLAAADG